MNDIIKRYIRLAILYVTFFICGCAVTYFFFPKQKVTIEVEKQGRIITNSIITYRYISTNVRPECAEYIDAYNHVIELYKDYTSCVPFDATNTEKEIQFSLGNEEITNRYAIVYRNSDTPKKILSIYITGGMRNVRYADVSNTMIGTTATLFDFIAVGASIGISGADMWGGVKIAEW